MFEARAFPEYLGGVTSRALQRYLPHGDRHPVVVVPAFMGSALSTRRLRELLKSLGYYTFDWRLGRNTGPLGPTETALLEQVQMIHERFRRKPSLVGWSLGGVYARILAKTHPEHLRSVITLGSPLRYPHQSSADSLYSKGRIVATGLGVSAVPALCVQQMTELGVSCRSLVAPSITRRVGLLTRRRYPLSSGASAAATIIKANYSAA